MTLKTLKKKLGLPIVIKESSSDKWSRLRVENENIIRRALEKKGGKKRKSSNLKKRRKSSNLKQRRKSKRRSSKKH
jgi:hypothetical protein